MGWGRQTSAGPLATSDVRAPALAGLLYFVLSGASMLLASVDGGVSMLWSANAVLLAMLLLRPQRQWWSILLAGLIGAVSATFLVRGLSLSPLIFASANMLEVIVAAGATHYDTRRDGLAGNARSMRRFVLWSGLAAPAVSGAVGATTIWLIYGHAFWPSYLIWFMADSLGLLIFTPFFFALFAGEYRRAYREATPARRLEAAALLGLMLFVTVTVFVAHRPMLFLIVMPTMLIAFRLGWRGAKVAAVCLAVVGAIATTAGYGPIVRTSAVPEIRGFYLQVFLIAQILTQWPVVAALGARDRLMEQLAKSERSLRILASQSSVLMLTFDVGGICRKAVGTSNLLPGRSVDRLPGTAIEDIARGAALRPAHEMALDEPDRLQSVEFAVIDDGDAVGEPRWLEANFRAMEDENGRCPGTLMTLHDVSVRKQQTLALVRSAHTDSLTGLYNRAGLMLRLERGLAGPAADMLSVAMIDIDRFKLINDNCGHQTGDLVLQEVARRIAGQLRASDLVGRMGGDEFVVLLSAADWTIAKDIAARLVQAVGAEPVRLPSGESIGVAISCGMARRAPGDTVEAFLAKADAALYEAKRGGRNQMVAA